MDLAKFNEDLDVEKPVESKTLGELDTEYATRFLSVKIAFNPDKDLC